MVLQSSGVISFSQIRDEFGLGNPFSLGSVNNNSSAGNGNNFQGSSASNFYRARKYLINAYNWSTVWSTYHASGFNPYIDHALHLGGWTGGTDNKYSTILDITRYTEFELRFNAYINGDADALYVFFSKPNLNFWETGSTGGMIVRYQLWTGGGWNRGIYLQNQDGTVVASYLTSNYIGSHNHKIYRYWYSSGYQRWQIYLDGSLYIDYNDYNGWGLFYNNKGYNTGFAFRDGGATGYAEVSNIYAYIGNNIP